MTTAERPSSDASAVSARTRQLVVRSIARAGSTTRGELVASTELSRATVTAAVAELLEGGVIVEGDGARAAGRGRRPRRLSVSLPDGVIGAIDLGHGHYCVALSSTTFQVYERLWVERDVDTDPTSVLGHAMDSLAACLARNPEQPLLAVGVVVPQPVDPRTGSLADTPFLRSWQGVEVAEAVRARFGVPAVIENDANAGAIAECAPNESLVFVKVSTGIGAGIVTEGSLVRGSHGQAGEIGHVVVRPDGPLCGCGNRGCLETLASIPAILRALEPIHGRLESRDLAQLIRDGEVTAVRALRDAGNAIGFALAPVAGALQTERIVVSGPHGIPVDSVVEGVASRLEASVHPQVMASLEVTASSQGAMSPLIGCLRLALTAAHSLPTIA